MADPIFVAGMVIAAFAGGVLGAARFERGGTHVTDGVGGDPEERLNAEP